jgi:hypothetical protein
VSWFASTKRHRPPPSTHTQNHGNQNNQNQNHGNQNNQNQNHGNQNHGNQKKIVSLSGPSAAKLLNMSITPSPYKSNLHRNGSDGSLCSGISEG